MTYRFAEPALAEYVAAGQYYSQQVPGLSDAFADEIEAGIRSILATPRTWRIIEDDVRRYPVNRFPHGLYYTIEADVVVVWAVKHLHRDPDYWQDRRGDLSNRQIVQQEAELLVARQKAGEAAQMKSMFRANMSHEIRTPMNAIIGLSYLALRTPLNPKQRDYVSKVHQAGTSLLAIINDLLGCPADRAGPACSAEQSAPVNDEDLRLDGIRVLLAEDNEINQQIACELLEGVGAKVTVVGNGREAVDRLLAEPTPPAFDAVLMDLQMPVMGGHEATSRIRSEARFANLPIVALTAHATPEERQRCLAAGMNDHLSKPIDPALLFETMARFHRPAAAGPAPTRGLSRPHFAVEIPALAGLDTADGLTRLAGNRQRYLKLLRAFRDDQAQAVERITTALAQGDAGTAERLAHSLKGVAGNLGAKAVQAAAEEIEQLIRERAPVSATRTALAGLAATLEPLLTQLASALPTPPNAGAPAPPIAVDPTRTRAAIATLTKLLEDFDAGAAEFIEQNAAILQPAFTPADWTQFTRHARNYAFANALKLLHRAAVTARG